MGGDATFAEWVACQTKAVQKGKKKIQEKKNIIINQQQKHKPKVKAKSKSKQNKISFISFLWVHRFFVCMATKHTRTLAHTHSETVTNTWTEKSPRWLTSFCAKGRALGRSSRGWTPKLSKHRIWGAPPPCHPPCCYSSGTSVHPLPPRKHIQTHCGNNY